jgi:hypothetical protein
MRKYLIVSCLFLAMVMPVFAFDYTYKAIVDSIYSNETASYSFTITNDELYDERFQFYTISAYWDISPTLVIVDRESTYNFKMEIVSLDERLYGPQLVPLTIKALSDETTRIENLYVYVKATNSTPRSYVPNIDMQISTESIIDPRDPLTLEVRMRNRNPLDNKELWIIVDSPLFSKVYKTNLEPLKEKTNQILFSDLDPFTQPGSYLIKVKLVNDKNVTLTESQREIIVKGYSSTSMEQTKSSGLFSTTETIAMSNGGTASETKIVKVPKNFFERIFTTKSPGYEKVTIDGVAYLSWTVTLYPGDSSTITVKTDYTILFVLFVILVAGTISYYIFRSPVLLYKKAKIASSTEHGVSEIKVKLHIKNRSGKNIRNVKIIDKYPKIIQIEEDNSLGTLKPTKMVSTDKTHSLLVWNFDSLDPYEERLLTYRLSSKLNIVGNISLPSARIKFSTPTGERTYFSNDVELLHKSHHHISDGKNE